MNINNFWWGNLLPYTTTKYQISANSVEKRAQEPQNIENWGYPYKGTIRKNGPIFINYRREICYSIRTQSTKFQQIRLKKALMNLKIPKIGGYPYMGAMPKRGPIFSNSNRVRPWAN